MRGERGRYRVRAITIGHEVFIPRGELPERNHEIWRGGGSCSALIYTARGWICILMESSVFLGQAEVNRGAGRGGSAAH